MRPPWCKHRPDPLLVLISYKMVILAFNFVCLFCGIVCLTLHAFFSCLMFNLFYSACMPAWWVKIKVKFSYTHILVTEHSTQSWSWYAGSQPAGDFKPSTLCHMTQFDIKLPHNSETSLTETGCETLTTADCYCGSLVVWTWSARCRKVSSRLFSSSTVTDWQRHY